MLDECMSACTAQLPLLNESQQAGDGGERGDPSETRRSTAGVVFVYEECRDCQRSGI